MPTVLVTGGSGFVGGACIEALVAAGHTVRATVRSLKREPEIRAALRSNGSDAGDALRFFAADLERDEGWREAAEGCGYVLHVASPFPPSAPKNDDELIVPAREGTLRVLRAARDAGVRRVVLTSSFAAIGYGHPPRSTPYDERDWSDVSSPDVAAYPKSKTLAERAAWAFVATEAPDLQLSVVNPVGVFGPASSRDLSTSVGMILRLMQGSMPGCPKLWFGIVDVRDVADLHLRAMTSPAAAGERFLAVEGASMSIREIGAVLRERLGPAARRVPRFELPNWLVRLAARRDPSLQAILPNLGKVRHSTGEKAKRLLGWAPRSREEAIAATGESLVKLGLVS
jgi:dihydroflavonol-4-reductase